MNKNAYLYFINIIIRKQGELDTVCNNRVEIMATER